MPYINAPFKKLGKGSWAEWLRAKIFIVPEPDLKGRMIDLTSWPTHVDDSGRMHFMDNGSPEYLRLKDEVIKPDVVVFATGYQQEFRFLEEQSATAAAAAERARDGGRSVMLDERPYGRPHEAEVRRIWTRSDPTMGFIGFLRPQIGAIPPVAEMQAMLWVLHMVQQLEPSAHIPGLHGDSLPELGVGEQWHYMLTKGPDDRIQYGIDHDSYIYQMARDMDCAPTISELLAISWQRGWKKGWNILPAWAFVSQINTKFRMRGPWRWDGAADVVHGELWQLVERNGGFIGMLLPEACVCAAVSD